MERLRIGFFSCVVLFALGCGPTRHPDEEPSGPSCFDRTLNGTETDVDCGGNCADCGNGQRCQVAEGCVSSTCVEGTCVPKEGCAPEADGAFCGRLDKSCGTAAGLDNCGNGRTVNCGTCQPPLTCGMETTGLSASRTLASLSSAEQGKLCDFSVCGWGGYGQEKACEGFTVSSPESQAACAAKLAKCPALSVTDFEACQKKVSAAPCESLQTLFTAPECATSKTCAL